MENLNNLPSIFVVAVSVLLLLVVPTLIHRLYTHPLAAFPGPKLAAATFLYEFYYDVIKSGMYIWEIERMHEKYGTRFPESVPNVELLRI